MKTKRLCVRNLASGLLQNGQELENWQWRHNFPTWRRRQIFFDVILFPLSSLVTGPSFTSISYWFWSYDNFFYKGLTRTPEIGNTPVWVLPNIWRLEQVRDTKIDTNVSNKMLLNAAKCQSYNFCRFWVIMGKPRYTIVIRVNHK